MAETEQHYGNYPVALSVGEPRMTWRTGLPMVGAEGLVTNGSYDVVSPIEIVTV